MYTIVFSLVFVFFAPLQATPTAGRDSVVQRESPLLELEKKSQEMLFFDAEALLEKGEYEDSNKRYSSYLKKAERDARFEKVLEKKFEIAEKFRLGAKRHLFGLHWLPSLFSSRELALTIYEEILEKLPAADLEAETLLAKAKACREQRDYLLSTKILQRLLEEFPDHRLALAAFQEQSRCYLLEMRTHSRSEDLLERARLHMEKFEKKFPEQIVTKDFESMRELYAEGLLENALLYKRKGYKEAYTLYRHHLIELYGATKAARSLQRQALCL